MLNRTTPPPAAVKLSCMALTAPVDVPVVSREQRRGPGIEPNLLALHRRTDGLRDGPGCATSTAVVATTDPAHSTSGGGQDGVTLSLVADHLAIGPGQRRWDEQEHEDLDQVGP